MAKFCRTLLITLTMVAGCALAQDQQPPSSQDQQPIETMKVNVNVVSIFFNVKDKHGALLPNLTKDDFEVYEDGKPQTIKYFSANSELPLTLGLLVDTSGSQLGVLPAEKEIGAQFLRDVLRPKDEAFLISFDVNVTLEHDFTSRASDLRPALDKMRINCPECAIGGGTPGMGGGPVPISHPKGTLLYDAVYLTADEKMKDEVGRKAMILLTDGEDHGSRTRPKEALEAAQKSDTILYVILVADRSNCRNCYEGFGEGDMRKLTEETGGRVIDVGDNERKLKEAFDQIAAELRSQYSIGYTPTNRVADGSFRKVEIKAKAKDARVQARKGYYAPMQ
jgi:VWFA-related protein